MKANNPFKSLSISQPFGGMVLRVILVLVFFLSAIEGMIRAGLAIHFWQEPLLGTVNAEFDIKIRALDVQSKTNPIDCIFLGSSQLDTAIDPVTFSNEYANQTGNYLNCYNFSLGTLTAGPAGKIAQLLVDRYHPKILILGISARDFSRDFGELTRPLEIDPWVMTNTGDINLAGWLTEKLYSFRFFNQIRSQFNPDYQQFRSSLILGLSPTGQLTRSGNNLAIDTDNFIPRFSLYPNDLNGLDEFLELQNKSVDVFVLEVPVHPTFLPDYVEADTGKYFSLFRAPIEQRIENHNVPFFASQENIGTYISNSGWNDVKHLNSSGAAIFSRWFARKFSELNPSGKILSMSVYGNY